MKHEENDSHSPSLSGHPSVDQNASPIFDLVGLPFVPKHLIFRYLDLKSLNKIRYANHSMSNFVVSHRNRLVSYEYLPNVVIECVDEEASQEPCPDGHAPLDVETHRCFECRRSARPVYIPGKSEKREKPLTNVYEVNLYPDDENQNYLYLFREDEYVPEKTWDIAMESGGRFSFFRGFADRFCNTHIKLLVVIGFSFGEEDLDNLEGLWNKRRLQVDDLILTDIDFFSTSVATVTRFLKIVKPKTLTVNDYNYNGTSLRTTEFFDLLPSFQSLQICADELEVERNKSIKISPSVTTLPPDLYLTDAGIFPIEILKKAIHSWWRNEAMVDYWKLCLAREYADLEVFAKFIDLPCKFTEGDGDFSDPYLTYCKVDREDSIRVYTGKVYRRFVSYTIYLPEKSC